MFPEPETKLFRNMKITVSLEFIAQGWSQVHDTPAAVDDCPPILVRYPPYGTVSHAAAGDAEKSVRPSHP